MKHTLVAPEDIDTIWDDVEGLIKKASDDLLNYIDIYKLLREGTFLLWIITDDNNAIVTAMTLMFQKYPRDTSLRIVTCGGEKMKEWLNEFLEKIEVFAKDRGCSYIDIDGRSGWSKVLKDYKVEYYTLRKMR